VGLVQVAVKVGQTIQWNVEPDGSGFCVTYVFSEVGVIVFVQMLALVLGLDVIQ
jgi:hypothetical protein